MGPRSRRARTLPVPVVSILACLALASGPSLRAEDFAFHEVGARAASLGGSFTARADDISAIFYNPAGLAFLEGFRLKTNLTIGTRTMNATRSDIGLTYPAGLRELRGAHFLAWQPVRRISFGLGLFSPFNFTARWPRSWPEEPTVMAASLNAHVVRAVVAVEPLKGLALSAGLDLVSLSVGWDHKIFFNTGNYPLTPPPQVTSFHSLKGHGTGFSAGALWQVFPWLRAGARLQSRAKVDLLGPNSFLLPTESRYEALPAPDKPFIFVSDLMNWYYTAQAVTGRLTQPGEIAWGVALTPLKRLSLSFDMRWDRWSQSGRWEFTSMEMGGDLSPRFPSTYREFYGVEPDYGVQGLDLGFKDARMVMAGAEYKAGKWFAFRAGFTRQQSSVDPARRTALYPDPGFKVYSLGAGYEGPLFAIWDSEKAISYLSLDFFVRFAQSDAVTSSLPGFDLTYSARRFVAGVGVGFIF